MAGEQSHLRTRCTFDGFCMIGAEESGHILDGFIQLAAAGSHKLPSHRAPWNGDARHTLQSMAI